MQEIQVAVDLSFTSVVELINGVVLEWKSWLGKRSVGHPPGNWTEGSLRPTFDFYTLMK